MQSSSIHPRTDWHLDCSRTISVHLCCPAGAGASLERKGEASAEGDSALDMTLNHSLGDHNEGREPPPAFNAELCVWSKWWWWGLFIFRLKSGTWRCGWYIHVWGWACHQRCFSDSTFMEVSVPGWLVEHVPCIPQPSSFFSMNNFCSTFLSYMIFWNNEIQRTCLIQVSHVDWIKGSLFVLSQVKKMACWRPISFWLTVSEEFGLSHKGTHFPWFCVWALELNGEHWKMLMGQEGSRLTCTAYY